MGYAKHVGRVGALAVALGIGTAVIATPGIAWADDETTTTNMDNPTQTQTSDDTTNDVPGGHDAPESHVGNLNPTPNSGAETGANTGSGTSIGVDGGPEVTLNVRTITTDHPVVTPPTVDPVAVPTSPVTPPPPTVPAVADPIVEMPAQSTGANEVPPVNTDSSTPNKALVDTNLPGTRVPTTLTTTTDLAPGVDLGYQSSLRTFVAQNLDSGTSNLLQNNVVTALVAPALPVPTVPQPSLLETVIALPGTIISAVLNAFTQASAPLIGPGAPADNPMLWAVLAFVRRQFNQTFANSTPVLAPQQTSQDLGVVRGTFGGTDVDGDPLTYSVPTTGLGAPAHGTVTINQAAGTWTYTPSAGYVGQDYFFVTATDGDPGSHIHALGQMHAAAARVDVTIGRDGSENQAPAFANPPATGSLDQRTGVLTGRFIATDPEGSPVRFGLADSVDELYATMTIDTDTGQFTFTPTDLSRYRAAFDETASTMTLRVTASDGVNITNLDLPFPVLRMHPDDDGTLDLADLDTLAEYGAIRVAEGNNGQINAIIGTFTADRVTDTSGALQVLNRVAGLLGATGGLSGDVIVQATDLTGSSGVSEAFYRLMQTVNGVPVLGGDIVLSTLPNGTVTGVFGSIDPALYDVDTTPDPSIRDSGVAVSKALEAVLADMETPPDDASMAAFLASLTIEPVLVVYNLDVDVPPTLAWRVDVHTTPSVDDAETTQEDTGVPVVSSIFYIHAAGEQAGEILAADGSVKGLWTTLGTTAQGLNHGNAPRSYNIVYQQDGNRSQLHDPYRGITTYRATLAGTAGKLYVNLTPAQIVQRSGLSAWDQSAVSLHGNTELVYDYFQRVLGRTSFGVRDGHPEPVKVALVTPEDKFTSIAGFDSTYRNFGFTRDTEAALDAVAHEYTHGVINSIVGRGISGVGLGSSVESEALEEAYGDILGGLVENKRDAGRWLVAEDAAGDPYRDMKNPNSLDGYRDGRYWDYRTNWSERGPDAYENSTIFSNAAYRMMDDSRTTAVSPDKWAQIFYGSLLRLAPASGFKEARNAVIASASVQGLTADQQNAIVDAFNSVGIAETPRVKIILRWGANPVDLDSHLTGPPSQGGERFHIYYGERNYFKDGTYTGLTLGDRGRLSANLDYDDTTSYGPETVTIRNLVPGDYYFYVNDYTNGGSTNSNALSRSGGSVTVLKPGQTTGGTVFRVNGSSAGTSWTVFELTIRSDGSTVVTPIDTYGYAEPYYSA